MSTTYSLRRTISLLAPAAFGVILVASLALALPGASSAASPAQMLIGVDMQPATNNAASLGRLQPCTEASVGSTFPVDIFIANVPSLSAWELRLDFDPEVVDVEAADYSQMLVSAQPSGSVFPSLFELEKTGRYFMAATEINGSPDSGSGVLAHLTVRAVGHGSSQISITASPGSHGPRVTGAGGIPVGDDDGDKVWDHPLTGGVVYVGGDCPSMTPIPTPGPSGGGTNDTPGDQGDNRSASDTVSVAVVEGDGPSDSSDSEGDSSASTSDEDNSNESDPGAEDGSPDADSPKDPLAPTAGDTRNGDSSSVNELPFVIGGIALAAIALGAGTLFIFRRRSAW